MIGLFLRKSLYEIWDTLLYSLVFNFAVTMVAVAGVLAASAVPGGLPFFAVILLFFVIDGVLLTAFSALYGRTSDYRSFGFRDVLDALRGTWKTGIAFSAVLALCGLLLFASVPFYFRMGNPFGFLVGGLLLWTLLALLTALQWFLPVRYRLNSDFKTCLRKSLILFADNTGFSVFLLLFSLALLAVSLVLGFLIPGWTAVLLVQQGALRLRMFKYDWLEEAAKSGALPADRRKVRVPWKEILADESENIGHRTLKNFFMPWKN